MEIEIFETVKVKKTISIDLPYYYKHDLMADEYDSVIYGKIDETKSTAIKITDHYLIGEIEISVESRKPAAPASLSCYFADKYQSDEAEYLAAK
jgi:hypothetical protein